MPDLEHARLILTLAQRDLRALRGMLDTETFANEIFGFHAQQAVEKALKAWLSLCGLEYPRIHDLEELLGLLEEHAEPVSEPFRRLLTLSDFAVQFRYEIFDAVADQLDRVEVIRQVGDLVVHVERLVCEAEAAG
jgi:HEPN domain-containing protein